MRRGFYWTAYALVMVLASLGLREMWQAHYNTNLLTTRQRIADSMTLVQNLIDAASSHVNLLRISAEASLNPPGGHARQVSPEFHHIAAQRDGYCALANAHADAPPPTIALSGLGKVPADGTPLADEINAALFLGPQFAATAINIPNLAWAYYTSADRFIAIYPFVTCDAFRFSDDLLDHEFFSLGLPERNPARSIFWTRAYVDEAGKGLMATVAAPVYARDRFAGTVAVDITLEELSGYVKDTGVALGEGFIINDQGQILAHPSIIRPTDVRAHLLWEVFGPPQRDPLKMLREAPDDAFFDHEHRVVYSRALDKAPWRFVYVSDRATLVWQALRDSKLEIAGFLMLALLIAAFERSRLASIRLKSNIDTLQATQQDLRMARDRAKLAQAEALQANQAKSIMLANASHDLRTPLNAIIGFSEAILTKMFGPISGKYEEYILDIHASGNLLLAIVNDVLDLSKIEAGRYEMKEEEIDVPKLLVSSRRLVESQVSRAGLSLDVDIAPGLPPLWADHRGLQQIVLNLLSNAIKFTPAGGKIILRANRDPHGGLRISVHDTGKGISKGDQEVLFTPFSRGVSAITANTEGTGLGLSIVKAMIELHEGSVSLSSELGKGTSITLVLPKERLRPLKDSAAA
jgi:signal transduction histidine kinase